MRNSSISGFLRNNTLWSHLAAPPEGTHPPLPMPVRDRAKSGEAVFFSFFFSFFLPTSFFQFCFRVFFLLLLLFFSFFLPRLFVFSLETLGEARRKPDGCSSKKKKKNERKKGNKKKLKENRNRKWKKIKKKNKKEKNNQVLPDFAWCRLVCVSNGAQQRFGSGWWWWCVFGLCVVCSMCVRRESCEYGSIVCSRWCVCVCSRW